MTGAVVAGAVLLAATVFGLVRRWRDGRLRDVPVTKGAAVRETLAAGDLGAELGERATLVQFSTAFCAPCRATRRVLGEVAGMVGGVVHVEIDAEHRLDLVRRLDVLRTPTVLVLDPSGRVVRRAAGQPRKADVIAALAEAIPE
ncbi:thioredoxin [Actinomadura craniellae]|uniref:Thioredoxin n=1 Tax=Actinomadura craniellae TaxID=2231787 RepID=A0A365GXC0_9ACTN|nr:thioredoxin family protein [Actinomadura craniellae]RAY11466.1 thioredoxin [Actinomadura craniellae]